MKKILLIGCGHMGNALLVSWLKSNKYTITVIDPKKYKVIKNKYKSKYIKSFKNIYDINTITNFDFIIFAVKPKDLNIAIDNISRHRLNKKISIVSIVAGKKIIEFKKRIKNIKNFFRVMPNMPAQIGQSMNCIVADKYVGNSNKIDVKKLFTYSGSTIFLDNETQIDKATAISGSGPGFVFNIIDGMEKAAITLGFKKNVAKILVEQTFKGSINLLLDLKIDPEKLVNMVATKGGTTEAGLKVMQKHKMHNIFRNLTKASFNKAKKQGK